MQVKHIIFYAGSLRPGGGLTVSKTMIESLASDSSNRIVVFTGAKDSSAILKNLFEDFDNVAEKKFFQNSGSLLRYVASKVYFLPYTLYKKTDAVISINYFLPCWCKLFVYHINLLSFISTSQNTLGFKLKRLDARIACKLASVNVFESKYLLKTARGFVGKVRNPKHLYIGIDDTFFTHSSDRNWSEHKSPHILAVTSVQPHKDNPTLIDTLVLLKKNYPQIPWQLTVVGGQSVEQWSSLLNYAKKKGVADDVQFLGPVRKEELVEQMQNCLCVVSTSLVESFCMVAIEAMAAGCPVIVTSETSMPESVGGAALIVRKSNALEFSKAIYKMNNNTDLRDRFLKDGLKRAELFSQELFSKNVSGLIDGY